MLWQPTVWEEPMSQRKEGFERSWKNDKKCYRIAKWARWKGSFSHNVVEGGAFLEFDEFLCILKFEIVLFLIFESNISCGILLQRMQMCKKPSTVHLVKRLIYSNLLGVDPNLKNGKWVHMMLQYTMNSSLFLVC